MKRHPAYDHWQQRRPELRPIWWAVCGWLAVVCLRWLRSHPRPIELVPSLGSHNRLLGAIVVVAAAAVSIWVGKRTAGRSVGRLLDLVATAALLLVLFGAQGTDQVQSPAFVAPQAGDCCTTANR